MTITILANWKSNKTKTDAVRWLETFLGLYTPNPNVNVIIAPPHVYLTTLKQILDQHKPQRITLAAQDISPYPFGSYTGAITADMVKDMVDYVLVGHSERRRYFHESHAEVAMKIEACQNAGITPILCLDKPDIRPQIAALGDHVFKQDLFIGYGPVDGVNLEIPHDPADQQKTILDITKKANNIPILYGGSIRPENKNSYLSLQGVSGLMVGSSSLDPQEFAKICNFND